MCWQAFPGPLFELPPDPRFPAIFALQALTAEYIVKNHESLSNRVYPVPEEIDREVAKIALDSLNFKIDSYTEEQIKYLNSYQEGT